MKVQDIYKQNTFLGRTLAIQGEKKITAVAQILNALKHSFTIQPCVSAVGELMTPMLVVFQIQNEPKKFTDEMKPYTNLFAKSSTSGLCDAAMEIEWFRQLMIPNSLRGSALLLDSWTGFNQSLALPEVRQHLHVEVILPKTTSKCQPLDLYFNRPFKHMIRKISDKARLKHSAHILAIRENIAKTISLVHYQFTAPRFRPLIQYAWFSGGLKFLKFFLFSISRIS